MIHKSRRYQVAKVQTAEELADKLLNYNWCLCQGFQLGENLVFLNDSITEDSIQEYAVIQTIRPCSLIQPAPGKTACRQLESLTVSWIKKDKLLDLIPDFQAGRGEAYGCYELTLETGEAHGRCPLCQ